MKVAHSLQSTCASQARTRPFWSGLFSCFLRSRSCRWSYLACCARVSSFCSSADSCHNLGLLRHCRTRSRQSPGQPRHLPPPSTPPNPFIYKAHTNVCKSMHLAHTHLASTHLASTCVRRILAVKLRGCACIGLAEGIPGLLVSLCRRAPSGRLHGGAVSLVCLTSRCVDTCPVVIPCR